MDIAELLSRRIEDLDSLVVVRERYLAADYLFIICETGIAGAFQHADEFFPRKLRVLDLRKMLFPLSYLGDTVHCEKSLSVK